MFDPLTGTQNRGTAFMAYRMAHITQRSDSSHHIFRLRTPASVLAAGAMNKRILFDIPAFMTSEPLLVRTTVGAGSNFPSVPASRRWPSSGAAEIVVPSELSQLVSPDGPGLDALVWRLIVDVIGSEGDETVDW